MIKRALLTLSIALSLAGQQVVQLQPNSGRAGTSVDVTMNAGIDPAGRLSFEPAGIVVSNIRVSPNGDMTQFTLAIARTAQPGPYTLVYEPPSNANIRGGQGPVRIPNAFTVRPAPQLVVRQVIPQTVTAGDPPVALRITGSNFVTGLRLQTGAGLEATVTSVTPAEIVGTIRALPGTPPGPRSIVVVNPDGDSNASQPAVITVVVRAPEPPRATRVTPSAITAGTMIPVVITGENFEPGLSVTVGGGVTAAVTAVTPTQINAAIAADANAAAGPRSVTVTNPTGLSDPSPPQITVVARPPDAPRIVSITPSSFTPGTTTPVSITGQGFRQGLTLSAGDGVAVTIQSSTETQIAATFAVSPDARSGERPVVVTNRDGSSNANQPPPRITIAARPQERPPEPPRIRSITPGSLTAGSSIAAVITGERFKPGASVTVGGQGVRFTATSVSESAINGTFTADTAAAPGPRSVTVTNPDGASSPPDPAAQIAVAEPERLAPMILSIVPAAVTPGQTAVPLTITGRGFQPRATLSLSGAGVTLRDVRVLSETSISAVADVARNAAEGPRIASIRNPDGSSNERQQPPAQLLVRAAEPPPPDPRLAPRVEAVTPRTIEPGVQTALTLQGVNFVTGMSVSFGSDVTVVGPLFVRSPREATVTVLALPTVAPGTRTVAASSPAGSMSGPGTVLINPAAAIPQPVSRVAPERPALPPPVPKRPLPKGDIILEAPLDPDSAGCVAGSAIECAPEVLTLDTVFRWRETNPGIADYFTIEIIDPWGKVLASAQTKQRHYRVTGAFLASIPPLDPDNARKAGTPRRTKKSSSPTRPAGPALSTAVDRSALGPAAQNRAIAIKTEPMMPGGGIGQASAFLTDPSAPGAWQDRPGIAYWRVIGFYDERDINGTRSGNFVAVEESHEEGIILPLPPTGAASCDAALSSSNVKVGSRMVAGLPPECENPAITCAGEDVTLSGTIDLSRVPFDVGASMAWPPKPVKTKAASEAIPSSVSFANVFIDWGDGTEPERLSVASTAIRNASTVGLSALATYSGAAKGDAGAPLRHRYARPSPEGGYRIRIFSLSDPDRVPAHSVASANVTLASSRLAAPAALEDARKLLSAPSTHLIACANVTVVDPPGAGDEDGLYLLAAAIEWPEPYNTSASPSVSACSEALRPRLRIDYWGQGRVRVSWLINGDATPIEQTELTLHGVSRATGEARKMPRYEPLTVPLPLSGGAANSIVARVEVIETAAPPPSAPAAKSGGSSLRSFYGMELGGSLYSLAEVNTVVKAGTAAPPRAGIPDLARLIQLPKTGSARGPAEISSAPRSYSIAPMKEGELCRLVYPTSLGDFYITDLTALEEKSDGFAGRGTLRIDFPTGSGAAKPEYLPISFSGWRLGVYEAGERRVTGGTADVPVSTTITPLNFAVTFSRIRLAPDFATADGSVGLTASQLPSIPGGKYPSFPFAKLPINSSGDLYFETSTPVEVPLGFSGFKLRIEKSVIDFSSTKGESSSAAACKETASGAAWTGILVSGVLGAPDFSLGSAGKMLPDLPIEKWSFGPGGFSAELHRDLGRSLKLAGGLAIEVGKMDLVACSTSFDAKVGLQLTGVPLIEEPFAGEIQVTSTKGILAKFGGTAIKRDWTVVALEIGRADFKYDSSIGDWAVSFDAEATLKLPNGATVYKHEFAGFKVTLDGRLASPGGSDWIAAGDTGPASLGGFPVQVTKIGAGARAGGGVWFGISGLVQFAKVLKAEGSDIRFKLDRTSTGGYRMGGVDVGSLQIDFSYPEASPTVRARADIAWQMEGSAYRFAGEGGLSIVGSLDVTAGFLYGRDPTIGSFWLAKASVTLDAPVPLGPTPLGLFGVGGGLAYKVPIEAFDIPITKVRPSASAGYLFSALVRVGTVADGGFTVFADGRLTIATGAGVRLDVGAWLLTKDHGGAPHAKGCIQYAGGSFDAGFGVDYKFAGDQIVVRAPSGPDTCKTAAVNLHFGPDTWHVWLGSEPNPIQVKVLVFDGRGYLMADSSGIRTSVTAQFHLRYAGDIAGFGGFVEVGGSSTVGLGLGFDPFSISGRYGATVTGRAGVIVVGKSIGIGVNAGIEVIVSAPPLSACGRVHISIEIPVFSDISTSVNACI